MSAIKGRFLNSIAAVIVNIAELILVRSANTKCWYIYHDPEIPDGIEGYRRF